MKTSTLLLALMVAAKQPAAAGPAGEPPDEQASTPAPLRAYADIRGEGITGRMELVEVPAAEWEADAHDQRFVNVEITLEVRGLTPGLRAVHIHETGACEPDFDAAGGHFDPGPRGMTDPDANHPFHMGDLPNLYVDERGEGRFQTVTNRITLSEGPLSIFDEDGTAVIIHANADQRITGPPGSGVSGGPRVACGVIRGLDS